MKEISPKTKAVLYDNKNGLHFNSKATKNELMDYIKQQGEALTEMLDREFEYQNKMDELATKLSEQRISEKDQYVAKIEQDCEDKINNLNVILNGKNEQIAALNKKLAEKSLDEYYKNANIFVRLFHKLF